MKVTMFSNAMSHHQKPFCDKMAETDGVEFHFVATKPIAQERLNMGYSDLNKSASYIVRPYEDENQKTEAQKLSQESDFVIYGSAPYEYIKNRLRGNKWTFVYSERIFKQRGHLINKLKQWLTYMIYYFPFAGNRIKLLCASAYAPGDFKKFGFKPDKMLKWGYFPKCEKNPDVVKSKNSIIWVARMISLKHPETALLLAEKLKADNIDFHLTMVGNGELYEEMIKLADEKGINDCVTFKGALSTDEVRYEMEQSEIMITTSDQNEGWGAVINEAMSGGCAVCASREMGAAPYLIKDGENGFLFSYSDIDALTDRVKMLLKDNEKRLKISENAKTTIKNEWNADNAAEKLVEVFRRIQGGDESFAFDDGVCSIAEIYRV